MILTHHGINSITAEDSYVQEYDETDIPSGISTGTVPLDRVGWGLGVSIADSQDIPTEQATVGWNLGVTVADSQDIPVEQKAIGWDVSVTITETSV
jgi:hypothetical protein